VASTNDSTWSYCVFWYWFPEPGIRADITNAGNKLRSDHTVFTAHCRGDNDACRLLHERVEIVLQTHLFYPGSFSDSSCYPVSLEDTDCMKIGLIAMSGIRVCDSELLRLGLTLPGFVERSKTIASLPSLGLLTLAALTPSNHDVQYIEMPDLPQGENISGDFDLIAISSYSAQIDEAYELARRYRDKGITVVMGGPHVSVLPDEALQFCDAVVIGEGEPCWPAVLQDIERAALKERYGSLKSNYDLADSPVPSFELLDISKYNRLTVQTSRGCPHRCEFCASSVIISDRYKQKPVSNVLAEIDRIFTIWKHPFIEFADDNSLVNRAYWKELLEHFKSKGIRWFAETDISVAQDEELLDLMRDSGCAQVLIGLESPVEAGLHELELSNDWKLKQFSHYRDAIETIQSHGITVNGCFVIGLDGHTPDIFDQVFSFVKTSNLYEVQITIMTPFPGTPLYTRLENEGRLIEPRNWKKCTLFDINFRPVGMTIEQLHDRFKKLVVELYSEEFTNWRRHTFKENLRQSRRKGEYS
jgi:radical SAM superfamily enzyme YgiQ (UPF0313 family)